MVILWKVQKIIPILSMSENAALSFTFVFFLFCIRLAELVELGEFN